jgi:hypothetical protein
MNFYFAATTIWSAENEKGWITTLVGESLFLSTLRAIEIKLKMQTSVELHACTVPEKMFERTLSGKYQNSAAFHLSRLQTHAESEG